jgi:hypothetical protein
MAGTVEAEMILMEGGFDVDGQMLVRSSYEQVVTFAWLVVDPRRFDAVPGLTARSGRARFERLKLHNDPSRWVRWYARPGDRVL